MTKNNKPSKRTVLVSRNHPASRALQKGRQERKREQSAIRIQKKKLESQLENVQTQLKTKQHSNEMEYQWLVSEENLIKRKLAEQRQVLRTIKRRDKRAESRALKSVLRAFGDIDLDKPSPPRKNSN